MPRHGVAPDGPRPLPPVPPLTDLRSVGVGVDGAELEALDRHGPVVVARLRATRLTPLSVRKLTRRLQFEHAMGLAGLPGFESIVGVELEKRPALIVVRRPALRLVDLVTGHPSRPPDADAQLGFAIALGAALTAAHSEGIVHGALCPEQVFVDASGAPCLSVLGLHLRSQRGAALHDSADTAPASVADDALGFGRCLAWWFFPETASAAAASAASAAAAAAASAASAGGAAIDALQPNAEWQRAVLPIVRRLLEPEPAWRESVVEALAALRAVATPGLTGDAGWTAATVQMRDIVNDGAGNDDGDCQTRDVEVAHLGRFRLERALGAGAMGEVWLAVDVDTGEQVAIKRLGTRVTPTRKAAQRFRKEARLLAELTHPNIARLLEVGEDSDGQYLVTEYVDGQTLSALSRERGPLPEREALHLVAELCRALVDVHKNGIVHRDVKPDNVMVVRGAEPARIKLLDFGVARHLDEEGSLAMTREGAILGTPLYMAPEQARGQPVDARSDVYAIGTLLYQLLIGEAPFAGKGVAQVLALQIDGEVPSVTSLRPDLSEEVAAVVRTCLEKQPAHRYVDAAALLDGLLPLLAGPSRPPPPKDRQIFEFVFPLASTPRALWPYVSNTDRLNRAIGLNAVDEAVDRDGDDVVMLGSQRQAGFALAWREQPYEWVYERRLSVMREYTQGPVAWYRSTVSLRPDGAGTRLVHTIEMRPRHLMGRAAAALEVGVRVRRALERTYRRIDDLIQGHLQRASTAARSLSTDHLLDGFEAPPRLAPELERRMARLEQQAVKAGAPPAATARLGEWLLAAPAQELARLRPLALARRFDVAEDDMIEACLHGAAVGMLQPLWDLLCPSCRVPSSIEETLKALREHGRCEVCNIAFALDLATSIELVFRVHPSLRASDPRTYCMSSPAHTPHVVAQVRAEIGQKVQLDLQLPEGAYQVTGRLLAHPIPFRVRAVDAVNTPRARLDLHLKSDGQAELRHRTFILPAEGQEVLLDNDTDRAQLIRIERTTPRDDVLTAARALNTPTFRKLFPGEILAEGALVRVGAVTLLLLEVSPNDRADLSIEDLYALYRAFDDAVMRHGGSAVKLHGDGVLAVCESAVSAVHAAMAAAKVADETHKIAIRAALHRGPAGAVTLNDRIDYFGVGVQQVLALVQHANDGELLISDHILDESDEPRALKANGAVDVPAHRVALRPHADPTVPQPMQAPTPP